jgi:oligosaccharide repeat unit polymerase
MSFLGSPWLPVVVLFALSCAARMLQGNWLAPSVFPGLMLSIYLAAPLILLADRVSALTVWVISVLVFSAQFGAMVTEMPHAVRPAKGNVRESFCAAFSARALTVSLVSSSIAFIGALIYAVANLKQFDLSFSVEGFLGLGAILYGIIVGGEGDPWWFRLTRMWIFPAAFLGGICCAITPSRGRKILSFVWLIPVVLVGITLGSRYGITMAIACWISAYLAAKVTVQLGSFHLDRRAVATAILIFAVCTAMYVSIGITRGHKFGDLEDYGVQLRGSLFGYLSVFENFVHNESTYKRSFGIYSLAGAFDVLGLSKRVAALSYEPVMLDDGYSSNIFTAFRGLIQDFSLPGALILCVGGGSLAGAAYANATRGRTSSVPILAGYYSFFLWSPIVSIFNYNSVWLGLFVTWLLVKQQPNRSLVRQRVAQPLSTKGRDAFALSPQKSRIDSHTRHSPGL